MISYRKRRRAGGGGVRPSFSVPLTSDLEPIRARGSNVATFTRATAAWLYNPDTGLVESVASGVARHCSKGVLIEGARTNSCAYSHDLTGTGWADSITGTGMAPTVTADYSTDPRGVALSASRLQCDLGGGTTTSDRSMRVYTVTGLSNPHDVAFSVYLKANSGTPNVEIQCGGGVSQDVVTLTSDWTRYDISASSVASTSQLVRIGLFGGRTPACSDTCDISVAFVQTEIGATFSSSPIFTNGTAVARNAEYPFRYPAAGNADSFPMTVRATVTPLVIRGSIQCILDISDIAAENRVILYIDVNGRLSLYTEAGNVSQGALAGTTTLVAGTTYDVAGVIRADGSREIFVNGASEDADTGTTVPGTPDYLGLGVYTNGGGNALWGFLRDVRVNDVALTGPQL